MATTHSTETAEHMKYHHKFVKFVLMMPIATLTKNASKLFIL